MVNTCTARSFASLTRSLNIFDSCTLCSLIMVPMGKPVFHSHRYVTVEWVGMILPTPTAEWSASLEQPCEGKGHTPSIVFGG